jgi:tetratricopeptide (TPR) repeat protein
MEENVDEFVLVWLRSTTQYSDEDEEPAIENLRQLVNTILVFNDENACVDTITSLSDELVFLRLGYGWSHLIPLLHGIDQIQCIYLSEPSESESDGKVRGVFRHTDELYGQLSKDIQVVENGFTHLTPCEDRASRLETSTRDFQQEEKQISWSQCLLKLLIEMPQPRNDAHKHVLYGARHYYHRNPREMEKIDEFERHYTPEDAIRWYTRDSFVSKMINKALRTQNIVIIYKFRFLIQDIHKQLKELQQQERLLSSKKSCDRFCFEGELYFVGETIFYRGQFMALNELNRLKENIGGLVSLNTFVSTSVNCDVVLVYLDTEGTHKRFKSVLFEYIIDPTISLLDLPPFANISGVSNMSDEAEVLLSIGTVARIESITMYEHHHQVHVIRLRILCPHKNAIINEFESNLLEDLRSKNVDETACLLLIIWILGMIGDYRKVHQLSKLLPQNYNQDFENYQLFTSGTTNVINHALRFDNFGESESFRMDVNRMFDTLRVFINEANDVPEDAAFFGVLANYMNSLRRYLDADQSNSPNVCERLDEFQRLAHQLHNSLSTMFCSDQLNSLLSHCEMIIQMSRGILAGNFEMNEQDLFIDHIAVDREHPLNVFQQFLIFCHATKLPNNDRAIELCQKVAEATTSDVLREMTLSHLAGLYEKQKDWSALLTSCIDLLQLPLLPANSPTIVEAYHKIATALESMNLYDEALDYYQRALKLHRQHHATESPLQHLLEEHIKRLVLFPHLI